MLTANRPAVARATRQMMCRLTDRGLLDRPTSDLIERALQKTRSNGHAGWVFLLADALGADRNAALLAGSFAELCNTAIDLADDVEDGDAAEYLGDPPLPVQINLVTHVLALCGYAAALLQQEVDGRGPSDLAAEAFALFSGMACGQRIELCRENWSLETYTTMSLLVGGGQFELYLRTATFAAGADPEPYLPLAAPLGLLSQIAFDRHSSDQRIASLPTNGVLQVEREALDALHRAISPIEGPAREVLNTLRDIIERFLATGF